MTLAIRDYRLCDSVRVLLDFAYIADYLEPEASKCIWRVTMIDGALSPHNQRYDLKDAYAAARKSLAVPMSWNTLRQWSSKFLQIYDCEFQGFGEDSHNNVNVRCIDSGQWEVTSELETVIERLQHNFEYAQKVRDV